MTLDGAIGAIIACGVLLALCFGIAHQEGKKGHRFRGAMLACFVALIGYGMLAPFGAIAQAAGWIGAVGGVLTAFLAEKPHP